MRQILKYSKENEEHFYKQIDELTDKNEFLACIEALENIPKGDRDYKISYQLARAYQNFAIVGENEEETEYELGIELLKTSISILESVKEEGQNKAEWNMRMAYGYQYLEDQEELAILYALRWAELDPSDKNTFLVVEECKEKIEKRKVLDECFPIVSGIMKELNISGFEDYYDLEKEELNDLEGQIFHNLSSYLLQSEDITEIIRRVLTSFEEEKLKDKNQNKVVH